MPRFIDPGSVSSTAFASSERGWTTITADAHAPDWAAGAIGAYTMFGGGHKRQRETQGSLMPSNHLLDSTIASTVASGLEPPSPLVWPQQQMMQGVGSSYPAGGSTLHKLEGPTDTAGTSAVTMSQPFALGGYQQSSTASDSGAGTSMLYGNFRHEHTSAPDVYGHHSSNAAAAIGNRMATDRALRAQQHQQQMLALQQQQQAAAVAAQAQQKQQQMLLAQAAQHQQQQQAVLARSAAAATAAAGLAGPRALYGNYRGNISQQQQMFGLQAQHAVSNASLPPRPHPAGTNSAWSDSAHAAAVADAAKSARLALQQQQQLHDQQSNVSSSSRFTAPSYMPQQAAAPAAGVPAVAGKSAPGRWSGQLGIISNPTVPGSAESDANTGGYASLECDEDLLSLDVGDVYQQQQQQVHNSKAAMLHSQHQLIQHASAGRAFSPESPQEYAQDTGSTTQDDMEQDQTCVVAHHSRYVGSLDPASLDNAVLVAARAAAVAAQEAAAAKQAVVMQVLGTVAELRKGTPVLTVTPARAVSAGAESVRSRMLITEVSVYTEKGPNSQIALDQANKLLNRMYIPDDITYMPVSPDSFLYRAGAAWQFPAFVICLGSSYLQRMFARLPQLAEAALACPGFEDYCQYLPERYQTALPRRLSGPEAVATLATLRSVQFTCLFLATKVADQIHALGLLRFMLTNLSHNGAVVTLQQAADVEARCLDALGWRLGPYFIEDDLAGNDEELWAESMGHWDYGTDRDRYPEAFC